MHRKIRVVIGIVLFLLILAWGLDRWSVLPIWPVAPDTYLPADAGIVVTLPEMGRVLGLTSRERDNPWLEVLDQVPGLAQDLELVNRLVDTLFPSRTIIDRTRGLWCINAVENDQLAGTWIIDLRRLGKLRPAEWLTDKRLRFSTSSFRGNEVWTISWPDGRQLAVSKKRNLLILAKRPYQVEAVLGAGAGENNWIKDHGTAPAEDAALTVFWNTVEWEGIRNAIYTAEGASLAGQWSGWLYSARLDFFPVEGGCRMEGSIRASGQWLDTRMAPASVERDIWGLLPNNTAGLKAINVSDPLSYFRQHSRQKISRFQRFFLPWMQGPVLELTLRPFSAQVQERRLYFFGFNDRSLVTAGLNDWMEEVGVLQTVNYQGFEMYQVYEDQNLFPLSDASWNNPWWAMLGDFVVLAADRTSLENWIDQYVVGNTLPLTETVRQMTVSGARHQFYFFWDWKQWRTGWRNILRSGGLAESVSGLGQLALRVESSGSRGKLSGLWKLATVDKNDGDLSWRLELPDDITGGPWISGAGQDMIIAVQDRAHRLYAVNGSGKIRWQLPLEKEVLSGVRRIRLQDREALVFNTSDAIFLLDLQGEPLEPFPLKLRNPTELEVTPVDFNQDKDFNFFVVSTDGCVYGYDQKGGPVPAWNPKCQLGNITHPLLHFQYKNQDYLTVRSSGGGIYAFARDGTLRQSAHFPAVGQLSPPQLQLEDGPAQIVSCSDSGLVQVLPLERQPYEFRLPAGKNTGVQMFYENVDDNGRKDFLLSSGHTLVLHAYTDRGLVKRFETSFPSEIDQVFLVETPERAHGGIGVLLKRSQRIYRLNMEGKVYSGFPLAGSTPFQVVDLFQTGESYLIAGYQDELLAYRLNE